MSNPFRYFNSSPDVIRLAVMMYVRYPLSLRNVEDLRAGDRHQPGDDPILVEPVWPDVCRRDSEAAGSEHGRLSSVALTFGGGVREDQWQALLFWRAVNHEGEVLETVVTAKRDKAAALKFLKRIMKKYGRPRSFVTAAARGRKCPSVSGRKIPFP
jgi:putative transposase